MDGSLVWKNQYHQSGTLMPLGAVHPVIASASEAIHGPAHRRPFVVIPGWSEGPDLRCAIAHRGISRFRVRAGARPGMTCLVKDTPPRSRGAPEFCSTYIAI